MVASLKETVSALKSELIITANQQTKVSPVPSFADILKNKTNPAVIIEPKDHNQTFEKTKKDIASNINPSDIGVMDQLIIFLIILIFKSLIAYM